MYTSICIEPIVAEVDRFDGLSAVHDTIKYFLG